MADKYDNTEGRLKVSGMKSWKSWVIGAGIGYVLAYMAESIDGFRGLLVLLAWVLTIIVGTWVLDYFWSDDGR